MSATDALGALRSNARSFEEGLPPAQRKRLGQFFSGLSLGTLLAQLALDDNCRTVIDPMAGHGDLLDAAATVFTAKGLILDRVDGIEIDSETAVFCRRRTAAWQTLGSVGESSVLFGNAFDPSTMAELGADKYDLVITNPPYVRYQSQSGSGLGGNDTRRELSKIVDGCTAGDERKLWRALVDGYSGLADLSVPAWILSALLTRPGGRLALVVPATWRTRDYADVVRYLLLRFFSVEFIVEDTQPGWFSGALVRTHLIVARRLLWPEAALALEERKSWSSAKWLQISPTAANAKSLVGEAFPGGTPEVDFAAWAIASPSGVDAVGIESRPFSLYNEWQTLKQRLKRKSWFEKAEDRRDSISLFSPGSATTAPLPDGLRAMLPPFITPPSLSALDEASIRVSQGLRTGCNRFFYVTLVGPATGDALEVEASESFEKLRIRVPATALRPVLHRQTDMLAFIAGAVPLTQALDLSDWILPEDELLATAAAATYRKRGLPAPRIMPEELAAFVRRAAYYAPDPKNPGRLIPDLSAVRTNIRLPSGGRDVPRFWYMMPPFTARHLPAIFTPRINHGTPVIGLNMEPGILIDANFSTIWSEEKTWTRHALYALFSSSWCRAGMEVTGTPLGGGALKLEATHIRQLAIPRLSDSARAKLDVLGRQLLDYESGAQHELDKFILAAAFPSIGSKGLEAAAQHLDSCLQLARGARQRIIQ
ncbi:methylase of polypeptide subunit release factors [Nitrobacteraceae bacterium AZCC 2161]